jgi:hypothetical protein
MKQIFREPLLHFLLLGTAIFVVYGFLPKPTAGEPGKIIITQGQLASIAESFALTRQRPPTREEWEGLVRARVREEVYYREALAMGLDKDDTIIRRRLLQKMEFVTDGIAATAQPTDDDLKAYLAAHSDKFRIEQRFTFRQLYLDPKKHGDNLAQDAAQLLAKLNQAGGASDVPALGDPFVLDQKFDALPPSEVGKLFGDKFAAALAGLVPGRWQGPIESAYGVHLVYVSERSERREATLSEVREAVQREWTNAKRLEANEQAYRDMLKRYTVTIEPAASVEDQKTLAVAK